MKRKLWNYPEILILKENFKFTYFEKRTVKFDSLVKTTLKLAYFEKKTEISLFYDENIQIRLFWEKSLKLACFIKKTLKLAYFKSKFLSQLFLFSSSKREYDKEKKENWLHQPPSSFPFHQQLKANQIPLFCWLQFYCSSWK